MKNNLSNVLLPLATLSLASCAGQQKEEPKRPNIIFMMTDDHTTQAMSCYGGNLLQTPNMDRIANEGIRMDNCYAVNALSGPSRACVLTGKFSHENGFTDNASTFNGDQQTFPKLLQQAGYQTAMIGKWGVGGPATEGTPNKMGFGTYYGCICQRQAHTYYPPFLWQNDRRVYLDNELLPPGTPLDAGADPYDPRSYDKYTQRTYSPDAMYDQVLEFVNANKERPFFLMWTTPIPHSPMQAPDADVQYYVRKFGDEQPIEGKGYFPSRWPRATYAAMITYFDRQIGGLVAELKRLGIWENTVIVITSDNGPASNSCSSSEWFDSAHPFRSGKGWGKSSLREGGIRMPFIVAWGGKLRPQVSDHVGYFPDVMPTLCELAGVEPPATDGISFLPALEGRRQPQHEYLYWEFPGSKGWVAVRWGEWKGLLRRVKEGNDRFELFNLSDDPREEHDLAAQHPEIIDRMWQFVSASHTEPANPKFRMEVGRK